MNVISNDIIATIQARRECNVYYGEIGLLQAYNQKLEDLQQESIQSQLLGQRIFAELSNELPRNKVDEHVDSTEDTEINNNVDATNIEIESEPQRNSHCRSSLD